MYKEEAAGVAMGTEEALAINIITEANRDKSIPTTEEYLVKEPADFMTEDVIVDSMIGLQEEVERHDLIHYLFWQNLLRGNCFS